MSRQPFATVLQQFRQLAHAQVSDAWLLERFLVHRDGDAFAALVERHGPLVLGVCRRILPQEQDAADAFQATFLILVRKSHTVHRQQSLAAWLHTVAQRVAWSARAGIGRRRAVEQQVGDLRQAEEEQSPAGARQDGDPARQAQRRELTILVEQEVGRLPEKYRAPLVLCDLQGRTHTEAAHELGLPQGSVSRHLERGRELLRQRLASRGLGVGAVALAGLLAEHAGAAVPAAWAQTAATAANLWVNGTALPAGLITPQAMTLTQGVLQAMWFKKLKLLVLGIAAAGLLAGAAGVFGFAAAGAGPDPARSPQAEDKKAPDQKPQEAAPAPVLRFSATEKMQEKQNVMIIACVKSGGLFFGPGGDTVFVQRGGGGAFAGGFGAGGLNGGGGVGGAPGMGGFPGFSPDSLSVWSLATRKKVKEMPDVHVAVPAPDGQTMALITKANKKTVLQLVKTDGGQVTRETDLAPALKQFANMGAFNPVFHGGLAFAPDGKRLAAHIWGDLWAWDAQTGKLTRGFNIPILSLAGYLPDGKTMAGIGALEFNGGGFNGGGFNGGNAIGVGVNPAGGFIGGKIIVWERATGKIVRKFGDKALARAVIAPSGSTVAAYAHMGHGIPIVGKGIMDLAKIQLWDAATGKLRTTIDTKIAPEAAQVKFQNGFFATQGGVTDLAFTPDGRYLASSLASGEGGHVQLWDAQTGKQLAHIKLAFCPQAIGFSRDGALLATAGGMGAFELRVWDVSALTDAGPRAPFEAAQFPALWRDLAADDPGAAFRAERTLARAPAAAVLPLLKEQLKSVQGSTEESQRLNKLVMDLDSAQFKVREKASQELERGGVTAAAALRSALKDSRGVEFQRRVEFLLSKLDQAPVLTPEQRRQQRALSVLEVLGTAEARQHIDLLSRGAPEAWLTQEAQAALQRLGEKKD
jgi:RNA polymerase sigma factor (sigma-70 family)